MHKITKEFRFEAAHYLPFHEGGCKNIHGHSYRMQVTVRGGLMDGRGMVIDFSDLKRLVQSAIIDKADHAFLLGNNDDSAVRQFILDQGMKVWEMPIAFTTAELMAEFFLELLIEAQKDQTPWGNLGVPALKFAGLRFETVALWETETSVAEVYNVNP